MTVKLSPSKMVKQRFVVRMLPPPGGGASMVANSQWWRYAMVPVFRGQHINSGSGSKMSPQRHHPVHGKHRIQVVFCAGPTTHEVYRESIMTPVSVQGPNVQGANVQSPDLH